MTILQDNTTHDMLAPEQVLRSQVDEREAIAAPDPEKECIIDETHTDQPLLNRSSSGNGNLRKSLFRQ